MLAGASLLSVTAFAATTLPAVNCVPFPDTFANGVGPGTVTCPAFPTGAHVGATVTAAKLNYAADFQFGGPTAPNTVTVTFVPAGPAGVTWNPASTTLTVVNGADPRSSAGTPTGSAVTTAGASTAAFSSSFGVNLTSAVTAGSVATSSGAVSVEYTYEDAPALNLSCPPATGTVGTAFTGGLTATGGVPAYTYSISLGTLPGGLTLNPTTGQITGTPAAAGTFSFTGQVVDSRGGAAGTATASCTIVIGDIPRTGGCTNSAAAVTLGDGALPENAFLVRYTANLNRGDSFVNVTNTGFNGAPLLGPGFGPPIGNLCVNVYTFSPDEQLISCCSCQVTPNGLASLSVNNDLLNTTLTGVIPTSTVVKLVASLPDTGVVTGGMLAWGTTVHQAPPTGLIGVSETPFRSARLSAAELASIRGRCAAILGNGSGFGVCKSCRAGALGASHQ